MPENTASNAAPKSYKSGIQTWSLVIAILIILPGAYAFLYFTDRDDYLTNRYFRALGEVDRQINQGLVGLDRLLEFALHPAISPDRCKDSEVRENYQSEIAKVMEEQRLGRAKVGLQSDCQRDKTPRKSYPAYDVAFFLDRTGQIKGCSENYRTVEMKTETSVENRSYFSIPSDHPELLFSWIPEQKDGNGNKVEDSSAIRYYSERIQSYDHGLKLTAWSFPLRDDKNCSEDNCSKLENGQSRGDKSEPSIFVLVKLMQSFFAPVLPFGFGFAVIDDHSGEVYYHANDQRSLLENFYIETDRNTQLIAAVQSRHSQYISGIYNAQPHRFYTSPLAGTPWSLVVFYDLGSMELASLRTVLQSLVQAVSATLLLVLIPLITRLIFPTRVYQPLRQLLPNGSLVKRLHARLQRTSIGRLTDQSFPVIYVGSAITLVFILFGSLAWITFSHASKDQIENLQRFNLLHSAHAILKRIELLDQEQQRLGLPPGGRSEVKYIDDKALLEFATYYPQHYRVNAEQDARNCKCELAIQQKSINSGKADGRSHSDPLASIDWFLPVFNKFDASYLQMRYNAATDRSWYFSGRSHDAFPALCMKSDVSARYLRIVSNHPVPHTHPEPIYGKLGGRLESECQGKPNHNQELLSHGAPNNRELSLYFALIVGLFVLYQLARLSATRLMGLNLPEPRIWAEHRMIYRQDTPIECIGTGAGRMSPIFQLRFWR